MIVNETLPKAPILNSTLLDSHVEEIVEVQARAQVGDVIETQVQVQQVNAMEVLSLEDKRLSNPSIIPSANEAQ